MNKQLSTMQRKVFDQLCAHQQRTGRVPNLASFAKDLGIHYVSLKQHLEALAKKGYLIFEGRGRGRSPHVALPPQATGVPVVGSIPAGSLSEAIQEAEGYLPLTGLREEHFALRVSGDSMADLIQNGDIVLLRRGSYHRPGDICAVRVGESEATLKYLDNLGNDEYALRPHNRDYPTVKVHAKEISIDGVYQGLVRGELLHVLLEDTSYL